MSNSVSLVVLFSLLFSPVSLVAKQQPSDHMRRILSARSVHLEDETGSSAVGAKALGELKKWGRFQIATAREQADLVFRFSLDTGRAAQIVFADGQTGSIHRDGEVIEDPVPVYDHGNGKSDVSLDVADAKTGEILWTASHRGGGLLTGFDSAGARVLKLLEKQMAK